MSRLFLKITVLEFMSAMIIVAATRAYVLRSYSWTAITEIAFITQWFWSRNISFDERESRGWKLGYPAYLIGAVAGTIVGLYISAEILGK